jgi:hypothetical protein
MTLATTQSSMYIFLTFRAWIFRDFETPSLDETGSITHRNCEEKLKFNRQPLVLGLLKLILGDFPVYLSVFMTFPYVNTSGFVETGS